MKKILINLLLILPLVANAQIDWQKIFNKTKNIPVNTGNPSGNNLNSDQIIAGLKEALSLGSQNSINTVSKLDGYFANALIKILMPPEVKNIESRLRALGLGAQVDNAVLAMNRAAENAAKQASPIFLDAIRNMSIYDGLGILKGGNNAATTYLRNNTYNKLYNAYKPIISKSLQQVYFTKYWSPVVNIYNRISPNKINPNLDEYVSNKALEGLFTLIAQEESKIRTNPAARVTDILQKVFGPK